MLSVSNITKAYIDRVLFSSLSFNVNARDRIALIGANGSGKTTLLDILAGDTSPDSGQVSKQNNVTIGYLRQDIYPSSDKQLLQQVLNASSKIGRLEHRIAIIRAELAEETDSSTHDKLLRELGELQTAFEVARGYDIEYEAKTILSGLGFKPEDFPRPLSEFSGGWLMRAALAGLLFIKPDMLLLDEPTNHLDLEACIWFEKYLAAYPGAVIVTSHDRAFLNRVVGKVISIEPNEVVQYKGNYDDYLIARQRALEAKQSAAARQEKQIEKETRFIERFRAKATKASQVQSRIKRLEKIEKIELPRATKKIHFSFPEPPRSGQEVIALKHVRKSYAEHTVYDDLNLVLNRGDKVALVGPNGAGKTTLLKILAGVLPFEQGERVTGHNVTTAYYAQYVLDLLNANNNILEELHQAAPQESEQNLRRALGGFLFSGDDILKPIRVLSGGEKARVALAKMLLQPSNLLLMDEPTNHLDIMSREILADALNDYKGTLCLITHDRTIMQEVANKIIEIENGSPIIYLGDYDDYLYKKEAAAKLAEGRVQAPQGPEQAGKNYAQDNEQPAQSSKQRAREENERQKELKRQAAKIARRIAEIDSVLPRLDTQVVELQGLFANPKYYGDAEQIAEFSEEYRLINEEIHALIAEWDSLSTEAERINRELGEGSC